MLRPGIFGENLFDDLMSFPFEDNFFGSRNLLYGKHEKNLMKTDIRETDSAYELDVDLPGFKKNEISAKLENGYLTIEASKGLEKEEKGEDGKYIRKERYTGQCARSFYVGEDVTQEDISARFEDGILKLNVPKKDKQEIEQKSYIAIEG
ncbi:MAG: Hsp20/alpha crystallin family protein [Clostridiales bacterium]|nr:Hsp20/alpha crystallin family protein [Clostridiales bacterium]